MLLKLLKLTICSFALLGLMSSGNAAVDIKTEIPLFLKIITYDDNFNPDGIDKINIFVVYEQKHAASYKQFIVIKKFFENNSKLKIKNVPVKFYSVSFDKIDATFKTVLNSGYNVLFTTDFDNDKIKELVIIKNRYKLRTFSFNPEHIQLGLAVSVRAYKKNPIIVNIEQAQFEGSNFSAHLLKMCEIYKKNLK